MTPDELKSARHALGLSTAGLARAVKVESGRTVRRWESGESTIPGPVTALLDIWLDPRCPRALKPQAALREPPAP